MLRKFRLKSRLLVSFLLVTCISGAATTLYAIQYFSSKIETEARDTLRKDMQVAKLVYRNRENDVRSQGEALARDSTLRLLLNLNVQSKLELYLSKLIEQSDLHQLVVVDTSHRLLAHSVRQELLTLEVPQQLHSELITRAFRSGTPVFGTERLEVSDEPRLVISAAIPVEQSKQIRGSSDTASDNIREFSGVLLVRQLLTGNPQLERELKELLGIEAALHHDGIITSSSDHTPALLPDVARELMSGNSKDMERVNLYLGDRLAIYHVITNLFGEPLGVFEIAVDSKPYTQTIRTAVISLTLVTLACIVAAFSIGYVLSRSILEPVKQLMNGVNRVTSGDLEYEIVLDNDDELGHLANSFNGMARELNGLFSTLETRVMKATKDLQDTLGYLDAIIDNMADGLVVCDTDGKVTRYNPAFSSFLPNFSGLRNTDYEALLEGQLPKPPTTEERATIPSREAEVNLPFHRVAKAVVTSIFQPSPKGGFPEYLGSVTLLRDITREKEMDEMLKNTVDTLTMVGTSLSSETNISRLLEMFVEEACGVCNADGGTLYTLRDGLLHFEIIRNGSMGIRMGGTSGSKVVINPLPLDDTSIAGYVATRKKVAYVKDVAANTEFDFSNVRRYDASTGYRTRAMLVVPMIGRNNDVVGVLQLINPLDPDADDIIELTKNQTDIVYSFACQAAVALQNVRSHEKIERQNIAFERFVPTEFLRFLGRKEVEEISLGDASQQFMSVLFSDIRSFTERSEGMTAEQNFRFLNSYLETISPNIVQHGGFVDKYIGDAIMALFPGSHLAVADDAVAAAIGMQARMERFNYMMLAQGNPPVTIGVGIHTGPLTLGTIGFEGRMESTVIGDTVNLASRMEGLTKYYGIGIAISETTVEHLKQPEDFCLREIDTVMVKGKAQATRIFEVYDSDPAPLRERKQETQPVFAEALEFYRQGEWTGAIDRLETLARRNGDDQVVQIYLDRCRTLLHSPPADGEWDGVTRLTEK